jgi:hypothetical protein
MIFFRLLRHSWLSFRRAHYFERGIGIKILIGLAWLYIGALIYLFGRLMPDFTAELFPCMQMKQVFFSYLITLLIADLSGRLFIQKIATLAVVPYLHLPIRKYSLVSFILLRSLVHPMNFYLLLLFVPFLRHTYQDWDFWTALAGLWSLVWVNHSIVIYIKASANPSKSRIILLIAIAALALAGNLLFADSFFLFSATIAQAVTESSFYLLIPLAVIFILHLMAYNNLIINFYPEINKSDEQTTPERLASGFFSRLPRFGLLWDLEWKLLYRNKRARSGMLFFPMVIVYLLYAIIFSEYRIASMFMLLIMFSGSFGFFHLQYVFSWESRFFDFISSKNLKIKDFIQAKYYFYAAFAVLQFLLVLPALLIFRQDWLFPFLSLTLYSIGPIFFMLFYFGVSNSTRIDPNKKATFNYEGTSGSLFLTIIIIFSSMIPIGIIGLILPWEIRFNIVLLTALAGLGFIATHMKWTAAVAARFERKKYIQLEKYREK